MRIDVFVSFLWLLNSVDSQLQARTLATSYSVRISDRSLPLRLQEMMGLLVDCYV